jgi:Flp pilus assembly protein TadD
LAELTGRTSDWQAAQADLQAVERSDPRNPQVLLQLGVADAALGDNARAEAAWSSAAALAPADSAPEANLAVLYARLGDANAARRAAVAALARDPSDAQARAVLNQLSPNQ